MRSRRNSKFFFFFLSSSLFIFFLPFPNSEDDGHPAEENDGDDDRYEVSHVTFEDGQEGVRYFPISFANRTLGPLILNFLHRLGKWRTLTMIPARVQARITFTTTSKILSFHLLIFLFLFSSSFLFVSFSGDHL